MQPAQNVAYASEFHEPLASVISRVEEELGDIAQLIDYNQSVIAKLTWEAGGSDPAYVKAMQDADLISQKLAGIAEFLRNVADAVPPDFHVETHRATGNLRLAELMHKIGAKGREMDYKAAFEAGDFDLF
jgi:hypothetical protein